MFDQILNLRKLKLKYKIILIAAASLILLILFLTQKEIFLLLVATGLAIAISVILGFVPPMKVVGIELVTFSTILAGSFFGSVFGAVFGVSLLIIHLIVSRYSGGPYIVWTLPLYAALGFFSGIFTDIKILIMMVVGINILDNILTACCYRENYMKTLIFSIGNIIFNVILILKVFELITGLI